MGEAFRLWGGEGKPRWPFSTGTESIPPLSKLGGDRGERGRSPRPPPMLDVRGFLRLLFREGTVPLEMEETRLFMGSPSTGVELVELADSGLVGLERPICLGGWGKEPILTVFRSDFPGGSEPAALTSAEKVGTEGEVTCFGPGLCVITEVDTARLADAGLGSREPREPAPKLGLRVFATGRDGSGPVGGAMEGLAGRGRELVDIGGQGR